MFSKHINSLTLPIPHIDNFESTKKSFILNNSFLANIPQKYTCICIKIVKNWMY